MKSIFAMTYYHLMHAIALAMTFEEKPNLYFMRDYSKTGDIFLDRIRETGVFSEVRDITEDGFKKAFHSEILNTLNLPEANIDAIGESIFQKYLDPYYEVVFDNADINDEFYTYNDHQTYYYYVAKHFRNIVGIEDGYGVLENKLQSAKETPHPYYRALSAYYGKYYPEPLWKCSNVSRIISSCEYKGNDAYYKGKIQVIDFNDLVNRNKDRFTDIVLNLFDIPELEIPENSSLILTQPLARAKYCTLLEYYLFIKRMVYDELDRGNVVYIKPHPADTLDMGLFAIDGVTVLPKAMPSEVFNYIGVKFGRGLSFNSSALNTCEYLNTYENLYKGSDNTYDDFKKYIKEYIGEMKLSVSIYLRVCDFTPGTYINVLYYLREFKRVAFDVHLVFDSDRYEKGKEYFALYNAPDRIKEYLKEKKAQGSFFPTRKALMDLGRLARTKADGMACHYQSLPDHSGRAIVANAYANQDSSDFFFVTNTQDGSWRIASMIKKLVSKRIVKMLFFPCFVEIGGREEYVGFGICGGCTPVLDNRLICRSVFLEIAKSDMRNNSIKNIYHKNAAGIGIAYKPSFIMDVNLYLSVDDGEVYYKEAMTSMIEAHKDDYSEDDVTTVAFVAGEAAIAALEYYYWRRIRFGGNVGGRLNEFIDSLDLNEEEKDRALKSLMRISLDISSTTARMDRMEPRSFANTNVESVSRILNRYAITDRILNIIKFKRKVSKKLRRKKKRNRGNTPVN